LCSGWLGPRSGSVTHRSSSQCKSRLAPLPPPRLSACQKWVPRSTLASSHTPSPLPSRHPGGPGAQPWPRPEMKFLGTLAAAASGTRQPATAAIRRRGRVQSVDLGESQATNYGMLRRSISQKETDFFQFNQGGGTGCVSSHKLCSTPRTPLAASSPTKSLGENIGGLRSPMVIHDRYMIGFTLTIAGGGRMGAASSAPSPQSYPTPPLLAHVHRASAQPDSTANFAPLSVPSMTAFFCQSHSLSMPCPLLLS
jgi:hypothetical protein